MKTLIFLAVMTLSSISFGQVAPTAELVCTMTNPDGDLLITMLFEYDLETRTYTLSKVGAAGRGTTVDSPDYAWQIKSEIDLSRLSADILLSQADGSYIQFTMLARHTGIVMRRGDDGFLPVQALQYMALIKGQIMKGLLNCKDVEMIVTPPPPLSKEEAIKKALAN